MQLGTLTLSDDLIWTDEFDWSPVSQSVQHGLTGSLIVQEQAKTKGRPITLSGGDDRGFMTRAQADALYALAQTAGTVHTLTFADARTFQVRFRRDSGQPFKLRQVLRGDDDNWQVDEINLIEV